MCCSVLQCGAVCCSMLQCVAVCYSVLQCVTVCCSVLQGVAVCCSALQRVMVREVVPFSRASANQDGTASFTIGFWSHAPKELLTHSYVT